MQAPAASGSNMKLRPKKITPTFDRDEESMELDDSGDDPLYILSNDEEETDSEAETSHRKHDTKTSRANRSLRMPPLSLQPRNSL